MTAATLSSLTTTTRAASSVKLAAPGLLPASDNSFICAFRSELRAAADPLRVAFSEQLQVLDSPLREVLVLKALATIAFSDRRRRAAHSFEVVLLCALEGALEDVGWGARDVDLHVLLRGGVARPGSSIVLSDGEAAS
jgi:hypothetical protein